MKRTILKLTIRALLPTAMLTFTSCSTAPRGESTTTFTAREGVPGGMIVDTFKATATVTAIDKSNRKVTIRSQGGKKSVVKAGPEVINFDQIRVGDRITVTMTEKLVVSLLEEGARSRDSESTRVDLAPRGGKPGVLMAQTMQEIGTVTSVDPKKHKATLKFSDGKSETYPVRPDVDLTKVKIGQRVAMRSTESLAIKMEKAP